MTRRGGLVGQRDVVSRVAPDRVRGPKHEPLAGPGRTRGTALDDDHPQRARGLALRAQRLVEGPEGADEEDVDEQEERDADAPEDDAEGELQRYSEWNVSSRPPIDSRSPSSRTFSAIRRPFTNVPFVLCRSYSV